MRFALSPLWAKTETITNVVNTTNKTCFLISILFTYSIHPTTAVSHYGITTLSISLHGPPTHRALSQREAK